MNILLIHQYYKSKDNSGTRWNGMNKVWAEQGHKITVIAGMYDGNTGQKFPNCKGKLIAIERHSDSIKVIRAHTSEKYNKNFLWRAWAYFTAFFFGLTGAVFYAKGKYDVVIATSPPLTVGPLGAIASIIKKCPLVFEVRDLWPESAIDTGVIKNKLLIKIMYWMEKISYKKASYINALTPAFVEKLTTYKKIPKDKVWMIPNAADLDVIQPTGVDKALREKHNWNDKFVGLYCGAHGRANHLWQLIETAKILRNEPQFLIACIGNGMEKDALIKKANQENLTNIQFLPAVTKQQIAAYFNSSDVSLILLKKVDTFKTVYPNKMFDSMSAKKPIILAIDGVARKLVVDDAECGLFAEPENAVEIADKMRFYRNNPDIAKKHGENGYKYVCEHYDRRKLALKYLQLIKKNIIETFKNKSEAKTGS
jgi:glycosyltransferase involved in cell wall biosynthesis